MAPRPSIDWGLLAGGAISVALHALLAAVVVASSTGATARPGSAADHNPTMLMDAAEPPAVKLGITESRAASITWIGFAEPSPHEARQSEVEQAELSPTAAPLASPTEVVLDAPADPAQGERPTREERPAESASASALAAEVQAARAAMGERLSAIAQVAATARGAVTLAADRIEDRLRSAAADALEAEIAVATPSETDGSAAPRSPSEAVAPAHPGGGAPTPSDRPPAERADKDSPATSKAKPLEYTPGKPLAGEGLEISTVRPVFSRLTRATANPRNPLVGVTFRKDGRAADVVILQSSGVEQVDEPVRYAVYRWTAKGKAIDELPTADPKAGVTISIRILLR